jgi:L-threonylcarbamoyladenylate synthase
MQHDSLSLFKEKIQQKEFVFAYPTEAVYGFGANPFDESAVQRILALKKRPSNQHFILIASDWSHIASLITLNTLDSQQIKVIKASWPGPITWILPASSQAPSWLVNENDTIAVRITAHPIARSLCDIARHALVSTSANMSSHPPCRTYEETKHLFEQQVDLIISGETSGLSKPTPIRDANTGLFLRN